MSCHQHSTSSSILIITITPLQIHQIRTNQPIIYDNKPSLASILRVSPLRFSQNSIRGYHGISWSIIGGVMVHGASCVTMQMYATIASAAASATPSTISDVAAVMMNRWGEPKKAEAERGGIGLVLVLNCGGQQQWISIDKRLLRVDKRV
jgi:hypothetical protein